MIKKRTKIIKEKRPGLVGENKSLQDTIKALQDQNTSLASANHDLDIERSVLRERLSNFGLRDLFKNLGLIGVGTAIGSYINKQYEFSGQIAIISALLMIGFSIYDNFWNKKTIKKEKVGK